MRKSLRFSILHRDLYTCQYCGRRTPEVKLHVDHIISVKMGGSNHPSNLVTACADCNLGKSAASLVQDEPAPDPLYFLDFQLDQRIPAVIPPQNHPARSFNLFESVERAHLESLWLHFSDESETTEELAATLMETEELAFEWLIEDHEMETYVETYGDY